MPISKNKRQLQIAIDKNVYIALEEAVLNSKKQGISITKSEIIEGALVMLFNQAINKNKEENANA
ncbi:MAG: hypothetical protein J6T10_13495 [Methanobrevibacter sp.]|nr:hypothetical protein [Methanobrevibacter sp.]